MIVSFQLCLSLVEIDGGYTHVTEVRAARELLSNMLIVCLLRLEAKEAVNATSRIQGP